MRKIVLLLALASIRGPAAEAHHSFAADYVEQQSVSVEGKIVEFLFRNPHTWVVVMVKDPSGQMRQISAEWASSGTLQQNGITKETLKPGDFVVITGSPSRNASERKIRLKRIERLSDGWNWGGRVPRRETSSKR